MSLLHVLGDTMFMYVSYWRRDRYFTCALSCKPCECLSACSAKKVPSFLSYFKTLSIGPVPGIEPVTFCFAVTCSSNWANTVAVKIWTTFSNLNVTGSTRSIPVDFFFWNTLVFFYLVKYSPDLPIRFLSFYIGTYWCSSPSSMQDDCHMNLRSFGMIRIWISDPWSLRSW